MISESEASFQSLASPNVDMTLMNLPALSDHHQAQPGFYLAATVPDSREIFTACVLFESKDDPTDLEAMDWNPVQVIRRGSTMGRVLSAVPAGVSDVWDEVTTIDVYLPAGQLENVRHEQVYAGRNRFALGNEIIAARTCTLIDERTYRLSGLIRGMRGTSPEAHSEETPLVWLNGEGIEFIPVNLSSVGLFRSYRLVNSGDPVGDQPIHFFTPDGRNVRPMAPTDVIGSRDVSNNLTVTWTRVTRAIVSLFSIQNIPLMEPYEAYEADVMDGSTVLRTISSTTASLSYSAAEQTSDGLTPGDPVTLRLYQFSDLLRRGQVVEVTV